MIIFITMEAIFFILCPKYSVPTNIYVLFVTKFFICVIQIGDILQTKLGQLSPQFFSYQGREENALKKLHTATPKNIYSWSQLGTCNIKRKSKIMAKGEL